jgi:hypothetical protein
MGRSKSPWTGVKLSQSRCIGSAAVSQAPALLKDQTRG